MEALTIRGVHLHGRGDGVWTWLRVRVEDSKRGNVDVIFDACIGTAAVDSTLTRKAPPIRIRQQDDAAGVVCVELWESATEDGAFMQFVGTARIDPTAWPREQPHERRYKLVQFGTGDGAWGNGEALASEFRDVVQDGRAESAYVVVAADFAKPLSTMSAIETTEKGAPDENGFRFVLPHMPIQQHARLRRLRIGEVTRWRQVSELEELLATTLHSKARISTNRSQQAQGLEKAMVLLQLSCQYALHSTQTLAEYKSRLDHCVGIEEKTLRRHRQRKVKLEEKRANFVRELNIIESSLDGMKMMLQQIQPEI